MILMVGILADPVICYFMDYCMDSKVDFAFVDVNLLGKEIFFDQTHWFIPNSPPLAHKSITGVFNRVLFSWANYHELQKDLLIRLFNWMDTIYPNVLNRPKSTYSNLSKPLQLQWAAHFLWEIPDSWIVSFNKIRVEDPCICKSISSSRSIVNNVYYQQHLKIYEPALVQEHLNGLNIRLHICDQLYTATAIESSSVDYRYNKIDNHYFDYHDLPLDLVHGAIEFANRIGLVFCGIDLIFSKGRYYFLEANPSPGYSYFESQLSHHQISSSLVNYLGGGVR